MGSDIYVAYQKAFLMTFSNIQGHTPNASLFTCNISTVLQQMARLQLIENVSRSICHSWTLFLCSVHALC